MDATVLKSFIDQPLVRRFKAGDVVVVTKADFERINKNKGGPFLKKGRHRFGSGVCHPCSGT